LTHQQPTLQEKKKKARKKGLMQKKEEKSREWMNRGNWETKRHKMKMDLAVEDGYYSNE